MELGARLAPATFVTRLADLRPTLRGTGDPPGPGCDFLRIDRGGPGMPARSAHVPNVCVSATMTVIGQSDPVHP